MTNDERFDALRTNLELMSSLVKDLIERHDKIAEVQVRIAEAQARNDEQIALLTNDIQQLTKMVFESKQQAEIDRQEIWSGINQLTVNIQHLTDTVSVLAVSQIDLKRRVEILEKQPPSQP